MSRITPPDRQPAANDASSRGSVLIFVIGVLLLLAIVATAFLGSSRADRTATQQNAFNTQVDLLLEGVVNAAKGQIASDETVAGNATSTTAEPWDAVTRETVAGTTLTAPSPTNDDWLASRVPVTADRNVVYSTGTNPALWPAISAPVLGTTFESPYRPAVSGASAYTGSLVYAQRNPYMDSAALTETLVPDYLEFGGKKWPSLRIDTSLAPTNNTNPATRFQKFLAADADGDGVADSGLFRIPVGDLAGLTYFGAVRIIDNGSAVNVNTAMSRDYEFAGDESGNLIATTGMVGEPNLQEPMAGSFPSNIGLAEMLHTTVQAAGNPGLPAMASASPLFENLGDSSVASATQEFTRLNRYRLSLTGVKAEPAGVYKVDTAGITSPYDDTQIGSGAGSDYGQRTDVASHSFPEFQYASMGDALTQVLGDRLANPGVSVYAGSATTLARTSLVDGLGLAYRFCLASGDDSYDMTTSATPSSLTEAIGYSLRYGLTTPLRTRPYDDRTSNDGVNAWFQHNFDYLAESPDKNVTMMDRRTILTGSNAVSDQAATSVGPPAYLFPPATGLRLALQWPDARPAFAAVTPAMPTRLLAAYTPYDYPLAGGATQWPTLPMYVASAAVGTTAGVADPKVSINTGRFEELFLGYFRTMARTGFDGEANDMGTPYSTLYNGNVDVLAGTAAGATSCYAARSYVTFNDAPTAGNLYAANGEYAATGLYYADPYIGMRFTPSYAVASTTPILAAGDRVEPTVEKPDGSGGTEAISLINGTTTAPGVPFEQHPLRQFRSVLRATPVRAPTPTVTGPGTPITSPAANVGYWNNDTLRLPADQVLVLRAALAAANLEALRDSSHTEGYSTPAAGGNDRINVHNVPLTARGVRPGVAGNVHRVVGHVYGVKRQPYITEVYANTSNAVNAVPGLTAPARNLKGYVAIKLYNPYDVAISLQYCRLVGLPRVQDTGLYAALPASQQLPQARQYPTMTVNPLAALQALATQATTTDQIDLATAVSNLTAPGAYAAWVVPPKGTLILENISGAGAPVVADDAVARPLSSGITGSNVAVGNSGTVTPATALVNVSYVPGLARVCWDRELVLMRPTNCTPPRDGGAAPLNTLEYLNADGGNAAAHPGVFDMVPLDSYDFTGLQVPRDLLLAGDTTMPLRNRAEIWYYRRAFTTPGPASNGWTFVYPGRYDGDQSVLPAGANNDTTPNPRQQGTVRAIGSDGLPGFDPGSGNDTDPFEGGAAQGQNAVILPLATAFTGDPTVPSPTNTTAYYPDLFSIQLNCLDWPGDRRLHNPSGTDPNLFPFGGFRRLGDMLEAPFMGAYTIQFEDNAADNAVGTSATSTASTFLEANPVTMDAALAEDTDVLDNENARNTYTTYLGTAASLDTGRESREQIGRFVPLRPTRGGGGGYANGFPATLHSSGGTLPTYDASYDTAFDTSAPGTTDPLRYRDDVVENDALPLPISGTFSTDALLVRQNRYAFASKLFDYFTIKAPHDDYLANYPTQPKWQAGMGYSVGDTAQFGMNVFVCINATLNANDPPPLTEINPGSPASGSTRLVAPAATANWVPLVRTPVANTAAAAGSRSDLTPGPVRSFDYDVVDDDDHEQGVGRQGLVNLNTAPEKVLAMVPWLSRRAADSLTFNFNTAAGDPTVPPVAVTYGSDGIDDNVQMAHAIALYRDGNNPAAFLAPTADNALNLSTNPGKRYAPAPTPFTSLYDLFKVPGFLDAQNALVVTPAPVGAWTPPAIPQGDFSPLSAATDGVRYDFEEQTLMLNRVSNLITTRSDTFTIYALVQGWRNVGTANPQLVVQRRAAFLVDRSGTTKSSQTMSSTRVPVN